MIATPPQFEVFGPTLSPAARTRQTPALAIDSAYALAAVASILWLILAREQAHLSTGKALAWMAATSCAVLPAWTVLRHFAPDAGSIRIHAVGAGVASASLALVGSGIAQVMGLGGDTDTYRVLWAPLSEELAKAATLALVLGSMRFAPGRAATVTLATAVGIGFAIHENVLTLSSLVDRPRVSSAWVACRACVPVIAHATFGLVAGSVLAARNNRRVRLGGVAARFDIVALALATIAHVAYNGVASLIVRTSDDDPLRLSVLWAVAAILVASAVRDDVRADTEWDNAVPATSVRRHDHATATANATATATATATTTTTATSTTTATATGASVGGVQRWSRANVALCLAMIAAGSIVGMTHGARHVLLALMPLFSTAVVAVCAFGATSGRRLSGAALAGLGATVFLRVIDRCLTALLDDPWALRVTLAAAWLAGVGVVAWLVAPRANRQTFVCLAATVSAAACGSGLTMQLMATQGDALPRLAIEGASLVAINASAAGLCAWIAFGHPLRAAMAVGALASLAAFASGGAEALRAGSHVFVVSGVISAIAWALAANRMRRRGGQT